MKRYAVILFSMILGAAVVSPAAAPVRYAISTEQIAATVNRMGMQITPAQITLLSEVVATTTAPQLAVRSIEPWGNQRMMARVECASRDQCLPFFVGIQTGDGNAQTIASTLPRAKTALALAGSKTYAVRSGSPVILELDGDRVHIRISVVCLENGTAGQTIRVSGKDHRLVYVAQVVDSNLVKGRL
jgi:hypothetical protein